MKQLHLFAFAVFFCAVCLLQPLTALALNADYLEEAKWENNANVIAEDIRKSSIGSSFFGKWKHYADNENMCLYTYLSAEETSLAENAEYVKFKYTYRLPGEVYTFSVDKDGMCDAGEAEQELFSVASSFTYNKPTGVYMVAIEYLGKETECSIDIDLFIGSKYKLMRDISLIKPTTTKATTVKTTKAVKSTTAKSKTTKKAKETTKKRASAAAAQTTKYVPQYNAMPNGENTTEEESPAFAGEALTPEEVVQTFQPATKIVLAISAFLAIIGLLFLLKAFLTPQQKSPQETENPSDN